MNRRSFLSTVSVASAAVATNPVRVFAAEPKRRPRLGLIGCGWFGGVNLEAHAEHADVEIVSLCDPNEKALAATLATVAKYQPTAPKTFRDYRTMLTPGAHDIVIVATPDHWHALAGIAAIQSGADVFLEKPISVDVIEGEALVAAARKYHRVVQVNMQRRSSPFIHRARDEYIQSGRLGAIGLVEAYSYLPGRPTGPIDRTTPPEHLDFELWTGPAPLLPFAPRMADRGWRAFMEYGNGQIGDLGVHTFDYVRFLLELGWPNAISSTGGVYVDRHGDATISDTQRSVFHYPNLDVSWEHRTWGVSPIPLRHWTDQWGARIIGEKGTLNVTTLGYEFRPADGGASEGVHLLSSTRNLEYIDFNRFNEAFDEANRHHVLDFHAARTNRTRPIADIEEGHISSACCILANLATDLQRPLRYDPLTRTVPGDEEATRRLARPYREGWEHPDPALV